MNFVVYGIDFPHKRGEFCHRSVLPYYFISCFRTDYVAEIDGKTVRGNAGDYMILEPEKTVYHGPMPEAEKGFRNDWLYLSGEDFVTLTKKYPLPLNKPFRLDGASYLATALEKIHREKSFLLPGYEEKCDLIMTDAFIDMYRSYQKNERLTSDGKLEYARGEIMKDYKREWTLEEMAKLSGYSKSRFCALYKEHYGISPVNDLIHHRIEQSKLLMLYGNMRLAEVSEAVGFASIYYFSKCFKKKEGISPTDYKNIGSPKGY
ncbi:MAG: helix-turn-helix transcriptional regulator [Clostridia bacterium]|nr:helix-turn-helix transcriptional regulator [Clostridia bacterium]